MPIPGSILNAQLPLGLSAASDYYPSLATLRPITTATDTTGQTINSFADSTDSAYVDLPCRIAPQIIIRPQLQEPQSHDIQDYSAKFQVNFASYINLAPDVLSTWQVKIDGQVYNQIMSVEHDGNKLMTRMMVAITRPFSDK